MSIRIWDAGGYELAEGGRWVGDRLLFVDILSGRLLSASTTQPGAADVLLRLDVPLGAVAPIAGRSGAWIAAAGTGIALISADGSTDWLARPEDGGPVPTRMNDGGCDPHGRFWAGSMAYDGSAGAGSLYRTDTDGSVVRVLDGFTIVNGPAFDPSGSHMFLADTPTGRIFRYSLDASGDVLDGSLHIEVPAPDGAPDGMTVDDAGRLWVAMWGGSRVHCYAPDGSVAEAFRLPVRQPTSVCLTARGQLFVTSAGYGLDGGSAPDGAVLRLDVDASAPPANAWGAREA